LVVAGDHDDVDAHGRQVGDGGGGVGLEGVGDRQDAAGGSVPAGEDGGLAFLFEAPGALLEDGRDGEAGFGHQLAPPDVDHGAVDGGVYTVPRHGPEVGGGRHGHGPVAGAVDDCSADGVFGGVFHGRRPAEPLGG